MKSELLRKALMATYDKGGKVKPPVKNKVESKATHVEPKIVESIDEIPKDAVIEKDPITGEEYWVKRTKGGTPKIKPNKEPGTPAKPYTPTIGTKKVHSKGKPKDGTLPKESEGTPPTEFETEQRWVMKPKTIDEPDPWRNTFGYAGEIIRQFGNKPQQVMIDGKMIPIQTRKVNAVRNDKGVWDTYKGSADPTMLSAYVDPKTGRLVPVDMNKSKSPISDKSGVYYTPDMLGKYNYDVSQVINSGAPRATGAASEQTRLVQEGANAAAKLGVTAPIVKQTIAPTNTKLGGLGIGQEMEVGKSTNPLNYAVDPKTAPLRLPVVTPKNMEETTAAFKKGDIVGKYNTGGPIKNPYIKYNDSGIYNQQSNKGLSKLIQQQSQQPNGGGLKLDDGMDVANVGLDSADKASKFSELSGQEKQGLGQVLDMAGTAAGAGVDVLDRKDGRSSIAGQTGSSALKGAGKGATIGLNPAVLALTGGNSAWIAPLAGAAIGGTMGAVRGVKEKKERKSITSDEVRENAQNSMTYNPNAPDTYKADTYNEKDYRKGIKGLFAKGGIAKGPGTGTSDDITLKLGSGGVKEGDFIIPAKQTKSPIGMDLMNHLGLMKEAPLDKKKTGGDIAISNGEGIIPEEKKNQANRYLQSRGIYGLGAMAPEANEGMDKKCGGMVGKYAKGGCTSCGKMKCSCGMKMNNGGNVRNWEWA